MKFIKTLSTKVRGGGYKITNTKNKRNRTIPIFSQNKKNLQKLYSYYSNFDNFNNNWFVFGGVRFYPTTTMNTKTEKRYIEMKKENKDINILSHHEFGRHSHASYLHYKGATIEQIALRLGDTVEVIRSTYIHFYEDEQDKILGIFNKKEESGS